MKQNNGTSACGPLNPPPIQQREDELGSIIRYENQYEENPEEIRYWEREYAFWMLHTHDSLLSLGGSDDGDYADFYSVEQAGNPGMFTQVLESLENDDVESAIITNNSITPANTIETNRKAVNEVYLDTWAQGYTELDQTQTDVLTAVAYLDPLTAGNAVYTARVMLDIDPGQAGARIQVPVEDATTEASSSSYIYPNPNSGNMSMNYELAEGSTGELSIFDVQGRKIRTYVLKQGKNTLEVDGSEMDSGVYLYRMLINGVVTTSDKLVIIK